MDGRVDPEATQSVYVDGAMEVRCCLGKPSIKKRVYVNKDIRLKGGRGSKQIKPMSLHILFFCGWLPLFNIFALKCSKYDQAFLLKENLIINYL